VESSREPPRPAGHCLPLSALTSQALVAFVVELDNEFEHQMPHRTTSYGSASGSGRVPWLVSMAMWVHCMRHVPEDGIPAGELAGKTQLGPKATQMLVTRMSAWWGYLTVEPGPGGSGARSARAALTVRPTRVGRHAQQIWAPLPGIIESRWRDRAGTAAIGRLRAAVSAVVGQLDAELPDYPPIGDQSRSWRLDPKIARPRTDAPAPAPGGATEAGTPLWALLSKLLLSLTLEVERSAEVALPLSANVLRVLDDQGVRVHDLPALTGVAEMAVGNSLSLLQKSGHVVIGADPAGGRARLARLTAKGVQAQDAYHRRAGEVEQEWEACLGQEDLRAVRESLEALVGAGTPADSPLFAGLAPGPGGWRAQLPRPNLLPHYPMVSHRGGYPDGS
jgi:DNA-binding MarR family transcriptional regulator